MHFVLVEKAQKLSKEILDQGKELIALKNRTNARKEHGIKQFNSITIEAKQPGKIDKQNPLTVQLLKNLEAAAQGGIFAFNRTSTSLYFILSAKFVRLRSSYGSSCMGNSRTNTK